ncbi:uncharacterized protein I206_104223 [Kwoniella pini CBS 10737]|uniref:PIN domain-containing protein n=1 Tax=Kwoniella pini CBS 10737 TaxID=1296096 RepID=A0A1B9I2C5_9TREE|nr:uncharacterized protein I206_04199 [Kwoniella pini CBS 10737]OCF49677.1 hypothetical protein I206_04199 [Kwoniella pini CBS 10737]
MFRPYRDHQFIHHDEANSFTPFENVGTASFSSGHELDDHSTIESDDMMGSHEEEMIWEPENSTSNSIHYLAIDTNIFISQLNLIRVVHDLLLTLRPSPIILLIPSIVIHELDSLKNSKTLPEPNSPITLGRLVQSSNSWLLEIHRNRRKTGKGALRCQSLKEKWDLHIREHGQNDDQILDCCLYFKYHEAKVTLWTDDKNLSVKAESNDIPTIGGKVFTLTSFLNSLEEQFPDSLWDQVRHLENYKMPVGLTEIGKESGDGEENLILELDHNMELDQDLPQHINSSVLQDTSTNVISILDRQEEKRYPYLLPTTNPQLASQPTSACISNSITTPPTNSHSTISPSSILMVHDNSSTSNRSTSTPTTMTYPTSPLMSNNATKNGIPQESSTSNSISTYNSTSNSPTISRRSSITASQPITSTFNEPSKILLTSIEISLRPLLISLLENSPKQIQLKNQQINSNNDTLNKLLNTLLELDEELKIKEKEKEKGEGEGKLNYSNIRIIIIQNISYIKIIKEYIKYHLNSNLNLNWKKTNIIKDTYNNNGNRKLRSGELFQSLMKLKDNFKKMGLNFDDDDLNIVINEVKNLN